MPVYTNAPDSTILPATPLSDNSIVSDPLKTNIRHSEKLPLTSIITHLSGASWTVDSYYSQVLGKNDTPMTIDTGSASVQNQYRKVKNQLLKVIDPISYNPLDETNEIESVGSSNIQSKFIPNIGDLFIAGVRDGYKGIFSVTEVIQLSQFEKTAYRIDYTFFGYVDTSEELMLALEAAVVENYTYFHEYGGSPETLVDSDFDTLLTLKELSVHLHKEIAGKFLGIDRNLMLVPDNSVIKAFDMFIVRFLRMTTDFEDNRLFRDMYMPVVDNQYSERTTTILDAIVNRSKLTYKSCIKKMSVVPSSYLKSSTLGHSAVYNGIENIIYPSGVDILGIDYPDFPLLGTYGEEATPGISFYSPNRDGFYIFSEFFYTGDISNMSKLEIMTLNVINRQEVSHAELLELGIGLIDKDDIYLFYYAPIICLLCRMVVNRL